MILALTTAPSLLAEFLPMLMLGFVWGPVIAAGIGALGSAYGAKQAGDAANQSPQPWGPVAGPIADLTGDAYGAFQDGQFTFGPDPAIYNAYLGQGSKYGIDTSGFQQATPGYGPAAYDWMMNYMMGPGTAFAKQPQAPTQSPLVAGLMGGLGGYLGAGGGQSAPAAAAPTVVPAPPPGYNPIPVTPPNYNPYYGPPPATWTG